MWFVGYSIGQMVSPQWWKDKYKPRNRVPWAIILVSLLRAFCLLVFLMSITDLILRTSIRHHWHALLL